MTNIRHLAASLTAALIIALAAATAAHATTIDFSFSDDPNSPPGAGHVAGTVTGRIEGLIDNDSSAATAIFIDSYPAALGGYTTPFNVLAWSGGQIGENSFTLVNGQVAAADFSILGANGDNDQLFIDSSCCNIVGTNFLDIDSNNTRYVWNENGIGPDGVTFTVSTVPLPATLPLFALTIAGLVVAGLAGLGTTKGRCAKTA